jgi:hypothetical protein
MSLLMFAVALWMVLNPAWWIEIGDSLHDFIQHFVSQWGHPAAHAGGFRNDRRTRAEVRMMGALLGLLAAAGLYQLAMRVLAP